MPWKLNKVDIRPNDLRAMCQPGIYLFWKRVPDGSEIALYIGSSRRIMSRISNPKHHKAQMALKEATRVEMRFSGSEAEAREVEQWLIEKYRPLYNERVRKTTSVSFVHA